jgi:hypothetical protein
MPITNAITSFDNIVSNVICLQSDEHACPSARGCSNCVVISKAPFVLLRWQRKLFCRIKLILALANTYKYAFICVWE